jgi:hypothetical protein
MAIASVLTIGPATQIHTFKHPYYRKASFRLLRLGTKPAILHSIGNTHVRHPRPTPRTRRPVRQGH